MPPKYDSFIEDTPPNSTTYSDFEEQQKYEIYNVANRRMAIENEARRTVDDRLRDDSNRRAEDAIDESGKSSFDFAPKIYKDENGELKDTTEDYVRNKYNSIVDAVGLSESFRADTYLAGQKVDTRNKTLFNKTFDIFDNNDKYKDYTLNDFKSYYANIKEDPNAKNVFYTIKAYDGKDENGNKQYIYKSGIAEKSVWDRNKDKFGNGVYLVDSKRFAGAEAFENALNRRTVIERENAFDLHDKSKLPKQYQSGFTEFVKSDILGLDGGKTGADYAANEKLAKSIHSKYLSDSFASDGSRLDDGYEDAFTSGAIKLGADIGDLVVTGVGALANGVGLKNTLRDNIFDTWAKNADDIAGYDSRGATSAIVESVQDFKDGNYASAISSDFFTKLEVIAQSAPEMIMLLSSGGTAGAAKLSAKGQQAISSLAKHRASLSKLEVGTPAYKRAVSAEAAATKRLHDLEGVAGKQVDTLLKMSTLSGKINNSLAPSAFKLIVAKNTNNIIEERRDGGDKDVSWAEIGAISASQFILTGLDKLSLNTIVNTKGLGQVFKESFEALPKGLKESVLTKVSTVGAELLADGGQEAVQEYVQTWGEILGKKVGVNDATFSDVFEDESNQDEALGGALVGAVGGTAFGTIGQVGKAVTTAGKSNPKELSAEQPIDLTVIETTDNDNYKIIDTRDTVFDPTFNTEDTMTSILKHFDDSDTEHTIKDFSISDVSEYLTSLSLSESTRFINNIANVTDNNRRIREYNSSDIKGSSVRDMSELYNTNDNFKRRMDSIGQGQIEDTLQQAYDIATGDIEDIKGSSVRNPRLDSIDSLLVAFTKYADVALQQGTPIANADAAINTLTKYRGIIDEGGDIETYDKLASDVSSEISTIGFVGRGGASDKGSIAGFRNHLVSTLNGSVPTTEGKYTKYSLPALAVFVKSRVSKPDNGLENRAKGNSDSFVANVAYENAELRTVLMEAQESISANQDIGNSHKESYLAEISRQLGELATADHKLLRSHAKGDNTPRTKAPSTVENINALVEAMSNTNSLKELKKVFAVGNNNTLGYKQLDGISESDASRILKTYSIKTRVLNNMDVDPSVAETRIGVDTSESIKTSEPTRYFIPQNNQSTVSDLEFVSSIDSFDIDGIGDIEKQIQVKLSNGDIPSNIDSINKTLQVFKKFQDTHDYPIALKTIAFKEMISRALFVFNNAKDLKQIELAYSALSSYHLPFDTLHQVIRAIDSARARILPNDEPSTEGTKGTELTNNEKLAKEKDDLLLLRKEIEDNEFTSKGVSTLNNLKLLALNTINSNIKKISNVQSRINSKGKELNDGVLSKLIDEIKKSISNLRNTLLNLEKSNKQLSSMVKSLDKYLNKIEKGKGLQKVIQQKSAIDKVDKRIHEIDIELGNEPDQRVVEAPIPKSETNNKVEPKTKSSTELETVKKVDTKTKPSAKSKPIDKVDHKTKSSDKLEEIKKDKTIPISGSEDGVNVRVESVKKEVIQDTTDQGEVDFRNVKYIEDTYTVEQLEYINSRSKSTVINDVLDYILRKKDTFKEGNPSKVITALEIISKNLKSLKSSKNTNEPTATNTNEPTEVVVTTNKDTNKDTKKDLVDSTAIHDNSSTEVEPMFDDDFISSEIELQESLNSITFEDEIDIQNIISFELSTVLEGIDTVNVDESLRESIVDLIVETKIGIETDLKKIAKQERSILYQERKNKKADKVLDRVQAKLKDALTSKSDKNREILTLNDEQYSHSKSVRKKLIAGTLTDLDKAKYKGSTTKRNKRIKALERDISLLGKGIEADRQTLLKTRIESKIPIIARIKKAIKNRINALVFKIKQLHKAINKKKSNIKYLQDILKKIDTVGELSTDESKYLSTVLVDTGKLISNGDSVVNKLGMEEIVSVKTALSKIPSMVKSFNDKGVPSMVNAVFKDNINIDKLLPSLTVLSSAYSKVQLKANITKEGITTSLVAGKLVNTKGRDYVNALEILANTQTTNSGKKYIKYVDELGEALTVGVLGAIASFGKIRGDLLGKSEEQLVKDLGISPNDVDTYLDNIAAGYIPDVLIGAEVLSVVKDTLGIRFNDVDVSVSDLFDASIKSMVIQQLKHSKFNGKDIVSKTINVPFSTGKSLNFTSLNSTILSKTDMAELSGAYTQLSYLSEGYSRSLPSPVPTTVKDDETVMNSNTLLDKEKKELLNKEQQVKWNFNTDVMDLKVQYDKDPDSVLKAFGYVEVTDDTTVSDIKKIFSINSKVKREVESLIEVNDMYSNEDGSTEPFFLKWGVTKSFRQNVRSVINFQESKIHREFTYTDAYVNSIDTTTKVEISKLDVRKLSNAQVFEIALSQAFDLDPDKNSIRGVFTDIRNLVDIYNNDGVVLKPLLDKDGKDTMDGIRAFIESSDLDYGLLGDSAYNIGGMHTVKAALELRKLHIAKKSGSNVLDTTLTVEADAITSGVIIQMLQLGTEKSLEIAGRGGVWTKDIADNYSKYTKKLLAKKYDVKESEVEFSATSLIEAGKYHQQLSDKDMEAEVEKRRLHVSSLSEESLTLLDSLNTATNKYQYALSNVPKDKNKLKSHTYRVKSLKDIVETQYDDLLSNPNIENYLVVDPTIVNDYTKLINVNKVKSIVTTLGKSIQSKLNKAIEANTINPSVDKYGKQFLDIYTDIGQKVLTLFKVRDVTKLSKSLQLLTKLTGNLSLSVIRSIAKSPVMIFNYGSLVSSIKSRLAVETVNPIFIKSSEFRDEVFSEMLENGEIEDIDYFYKDVNNFKVYVDDVLRKPTEEELSNIKASEYSKHIVLEDPLVVDKLRRLSNNFLGNSFATVFEETFGELSDLRAGMKISDTVIASSFKLELNKRLNELRTSKDSITKEDVINIIRDIEKEGLGHTLDIDGVSQPLYATESSDSELQASVSLDPLNTSTTTKANSRYVTDNTGAAPTISIHRIDGQAIAKAIDLDDFGNVYDAIIFGTNHNDIQSGSNRYQESIISTSNSFGNFESYLGKAIKMMGRLTKDELYNMLTPIVRAGKSNNLVRKRTVVMSRGFKFKNGTNVAGRQFPFNGDYTVQLKYNADQVFINYVDSKGVIKKTTVATRDKDTGLFSIQSIVRTSTSSVVLKSNAITGSRFYTEGVELDLSSSANLLDSLDNDIATNMNINIVPIYAGKHKTTAPLSSVVSSESLGALRIKDKSESFLTDSMGRIGVGVLDIVDVLRRSASLSNNRGNVFTKGNELIVNHLGLVGALPQTVKITKDVKLIDDSVLDRLEDTFNTVKSDISKDIVDYLTSKYGNSTDNDVQNYLREINSSQKPYLLSDSSASDSIVELIATQKELGLKKEGYSSQAPKIDISEVVSDKIDNNNCGGK